MDAWLPENSQLWSGRCFLESHVPHPRKFKQEFWHFFLGFTAILKSILNKSNMTTCVGFRAVFTRFHLCSAFINEYSHSAYLQEYRCIFRSLMSKPGRQCWGKSQWDYMRKKYLERFWKGTCPLLSYTRYWDYISLYRFWGEKGKQYWVFPGCSVWAQNSVWLQQLFLGTNLQYAGEIIYFYTVIWCLSLSYDLFSFLPSLSG